MRRRVERTGHLRLPRMGGNRLAKWDFFALLIVVTRASEVGPAVAVQRAAMGAAFPLFSVQGRVRPPLEPQSQAFLQRRQRNQDFPRRSAVLGGPLASSAQTAM